MPVSAIRSALQEVQSPTRPLAHRPHTHNKKLTLSVCYATNFECPEAPCPWRQIWGRVRFLKFFMTARPLSFMFDALSNLERAVEAAAKSIRAAKVQDKAVLNRITSYKEIIRRQHSLLDDLTRASAREDWREVSRITSLVHGSSLMIKVDAGFLLSNMRSRGGSSGASSN
ncbi:MAG: hypothetical protein RIS36_590 [Pseudomonadota bacterium]